MCCILNGGKKYVADLMISSVMLYSHKLKGDEATVCQSQYKNSIWLVA